ncbi:unnamed protein product [Rotaria sordida]|uniref:Methyltransferase FkbM domain-containing protein n=1 Tax=Rotaria sordida TaxID=392033 RepID=A0A819HVW1_9BILA|nr:unnamed protein product [Rotaria sordida]
MNEILLVQAQNGRDSPSFFIQLLQYNNTQTSSQCFINYPNSSQNYYVYTVAVGKKPNKNQIQFFFAGEWINGSSRPFIGIAKYNLTNDLSDSSNSCANSFSYSIQYLDNYEHQEYYVIGVEPKGLLAYGFANEFVTIFDSQNVSILESWNSSLTWSNSSFKPCAVEISDNFGIIAGFVQNGLEERVKYSPIIYLLNFNSSNRHPIVVDQYIPIATPGTWQDLLTYSNVNIYSAINSMSISINSRGNVLVGMPFINRVFLLSVNISDPRKLTYISRNTGGRSLGNGKSVAWLNDGNMTAILVNTYSLTYQWTSSKIYFYDMISSTYNSNSTPLSVFPNYHQLVPDSFSFTFLNIISSSISLTLMDDKGNLLIFYPTPPGFFPSITDTGSVPLITSTEACLPGMYKDQYGINDCILCPTGTKNPGNSSIKCMLCANGSFCSLGSVDEIPQSALETVVQVIAYLKSPEIMVCFAYSFSDIFYRQYPYETSSGSYFDCEESIRNAKFETGLQSLAIPRSHTETPMFECTLEIPSAFDYVSGVHQISNSIDKTKIDIDNLTCKTSIDSYEECYKYATELVPYKYVGVGIETIMLLRLKLKAVNQPLLNSSLYWNEEDRFKPFNNLMSSRNECQILYCGAHEAGTDGLEFIKQYENCHVWFLEPVAQFYDKLIHSRRILRQLETVKHHMYNIGLSNKNELIDLTWKDIRKSQALTLVGKHENKNDIGNNLKYKLILRDVAEILFEFHILLKISNSIIIGELNLLHINCEGCEYDVIERLIKKNLTKYIRIIQFGSHRPLSIRSSINRRYCCLQQMLSMTHHLEFGIPWAWERWLRTDLVEKK